MVTMASRDEGARRSVRGACTGGQEDRSPGLIPPAVIRVARWGADAVARARWGRAHSRFPGGLGACRADARMPREQLSAC